MRIHKDNALADKKEKELRQLADGLNARDIEGKKQVNFFSSLFFSLKKVLSGFRWQRCCPIMHVRYNKPYSLTVSVTVLVSCIVVRIE